MPLTLSNAAIQQFKLQFELEYQASEKLANTTNQVMNVRGDAYKIPYMGEVDSQERGAYQSMLQPEAMSISQPSISFDNYATMLALDTFQNHETAGDTLASMAATLAKSTGRRCDQVKMDALQADAGSTIAVGTTNMSVDKIKEAKSAMDEANVDSDDRYLLVSPSQIDSLLGTDEVSNVLYNNQRTLVDGVVNSFLGFKIITVGSYGGLTGLDKTDDTRHCLAWSKSAIWTAYSMAPSVDSQWSAAHQSWLQVARVRLGAKVAQTAGVIKIDCLETA